jgi:hypothetical protein
MDSEYVIFGKWDNHGNEGNLRLSSQDSQKVDEDVELVFKHGNKHISGVKDVSDLKDALNYAAIREVDGFDLERAYKAVELFNKYYGFEMDPEEAVSGWKLDRKIKS